MAKRRLLLNTLNNAIRSKNIPGFNLVLVLGQTKRPRYQRSGGEEVGDSRFLGGPAEEEGC